MRPRRLIARSARDPRSLERGCQPGVVAVHFRIIRPVQPVESVATHSNFSLLENDFSLVVDFDHLMVELIADQGVPVAQAHRSRRIRR